MKILDLFCGAGGCSVGYARAGFHVVGVDIEPRHHYPFFNVVQDDAIAVLRDIEYVQAFDAIHASPPCQAYSVSKSIHGSGHKHPDLVGPVRDLLEATGLPYVIENVPGAPLINPTVLCGQTFGLGVFRHRLFETNWPSSAPHHEPHDGTVGDGRYFTVAGHGGGRSTRDGFHLGSKEEWETAMGIDWMDKDELAQAIPPAYTHHIGGQLMKYLSGNAGPWRQAYERGWAASKRSETCDLDAAETRYLRRHGHEMLDAFLAGWGDRASGHPKWTSEAVA